MKKLLNLAQHFIVRLTATQSVVYVKTILYTLLVGLFAVGCGIKGRPLPPLPPSATTTTTESSQTLEQNSAGNNLESETTQKADAKNSTSKNSKSTSEEGKKPKK